MGKGEQTRKAIVDRALSMVSTNGLGGLSIGTLAKSLDMSKSGLFAHFRSKEHLELEVIEAAKLQFRTLVVLPALAKGRGEPRIRALFENFLSWERASPGGCPYISAGTELDDKPGAPRDLVATSGREWMAVLARAAQVAVDEGHFRSKLDTEQFAFELWGFCLGYHQAHRLLEDLQAEDYLRRAFNLLLDRSRPY